MSFPAWFPGPHRVFGMINPDAWAIKDGNGRIIAELVTKGVPGRSEATARLYAAALDLYSVLELVRGYVADLTPLPGAVSDLAVIDAALAKARGEA